MESKLIGIFDHRLSTHGVLLGVTKNEPHFTYSKENKRTGFGFIPYKNRY